MRAREFLDLVRTHTGMLEGLHRELSALMDARDECLPWTTRASGTGSSPGTHSDPTASEAQARIEGLDAEIAKVRRRLDESERVVGEGLAAIERVRLAFGTVHADVLELYYIDCTETWSEVAWELGISASAVRLRREQAIVWLDFHMPAFMPK